MITFSLSLSLFLYLSRASFSQGSSSSFVTSRRSRFPSSGATRDRGCRRAAGSSRPLRIHDTINRLGYGVLGPDRRVSSARQLLRGTLTPSTPRLRRRRDAPKIRRVPAGDSRRQILHRAKVSRAFRDFRGTPRGPRRGAISERSWREKERGGGGGREAFINILEQAL